MIDPNFFPPMDLLLTTLLSFIIIAFCIFNCGLLIMPTFFKFFKISDVERVYWDDIRASIKITSYVSIRLFGSLIIGLLILLLIRNVILPEFFNEDQMRSIKIKMDFFRLDIYSPVILSIIFSFSFYFKILLKVRNFKDESN